LCKCVCMFFFPVQFVLMVYVGLLGGAMYVNVFALLVEDVRIPTVDRELGINFVAIFVNVGIVAASLFEILLDKAIMPKNDG
jgi:battenin